MTKNLENIKVCHLTSVHPRFDVRIYYKECHSLKKAGYDVNLVVADGKGTTEVSEIKIYDVGLPNNRISRIAKTLWRVYKTALAINADVYHLHDPELLLIALFIKWKGKKVIYDAHEDLPRQVLYKAYLPNWLRKILSVFIELFENFAAAKMSGIVTATPIINDRFIKLNKQSVDVNNFPLLGEKFSSANWHDKKDIACYIGGISEVRGIKQMVQAMEHVNGYRLNLGGQFESENLRKEVMKYKGWEKINEYGFIDRGKVAEILNESRIGLVTLLPSKNYLDSLPVKMFEYMLAGIPVIASNFPGWKHIVEEAECGVCVDPLQPKEIAEAVELLMHNRNEAEQMGKNGRKAVLEKYNWSIEEPKLFELYNRILAG